MADIEERWTTASFEEKYQAMMTKMTEADQKRSAEQVAYICECRTCPTYTERGEPNLAFCNQGKSALTHEQKGCLCPSCPKEDNEPPLGVLLHSRFSFGTFRFVAERKSH